MSLVEALDPIYVRAHLKSFSCTGQSLNEEELCAINAFLMLCRSNEEIDLLRKDAQNCVEYYKHKKTCITRTIELLMNSSDQYAKGSISLLYSYLNTVEKLLDQSRSVQDKIASGDFHNASFDEENDSFNEEEENSDNEFCIE